MATGSTTKTNQKKSLLYRGFTAKASISTTQYLPPSQFEVGINNATVTSIDNIIIAVNIVEDNTLIASVTKIKFKKFFFIT